MVHRLVEGEVIAVAQDKIEGLTEPGKRSIWPPIPTGDESTSHIAALVERLQRDAGRAVGFDALCSAIWPDKPNRGTPSASVGASGAQDIAARRNLDGARLRLCLDWPTPRGNAAVVA